jgi:hypothetical protein
VGIVRIVARAAMGIVGAAVAAVAVTVIAARVRSAQKVVRAAMPTICPPF